MSKPPSSTPPRSGGLSLYANLLDPSTSTSTASISRGPVVFKQGSDGASADDASVKKQQINAGIY
jgi:splicing factor 45